MAARPRRADRKRTGKKARNKMGRKPLKSHGTAEIGHSRPNQVNSLWGRLAKQNHFAGEINRFASEIVFFVCEISRRS